jgi:hypothetical protein
VTTEKNNNKDNINNPVTCGLWVENKETKKPFGAKTTQFNG